MVQFEVHMGSAAEKYYLVHRNNPMEISVAWSTPSSTCC